MMSRSFEWKIRPAVASDYDQLCELFDEVDSLHTENLPDIFHKPCGPPRSRERVSNLIDGSCSTIFVAERGNAVLGLAVVVMLPHSANPLRLPRRVAEIVTVVVRQSVRREGIGTSLIRASVSWAKQQDAEHVEISVYSFNVDALRTYTALGFEIVSQRMLLRSPFEECQ